MKYNCLQSVSASNELQSFVQVACCLPTRHRELPSELWHPKNYQFSSLLLGQEGIPSTFGSAKQGHRNQSRKGPRCKHADGSAPEELCFEVPIPMALASL